MITKNQLKVTAEPGKQDILMTREFEAPRENVFKAFTDPKLMVQWLGPRNMTMKIDYYHAKSGGSYRYVHIDDKGNQYAFNGVIHEITFPERAIQTFEFEGLPEKGHVSLDTALFEELPGNRTKLTIQSVFRSVADRDGMVMSGMEGGMNEGFSRLDELLAKK
ncbi:ATPase [Cytophagales bacterium WSM2-2]|nr:ATPase [Cytophagales bacterium WSM2-2]